MEFYELRSKAKAGDEELLNRLEILRNALAQVSAMTSEPNSPYQSESTGIGAN